MTRELRENISILLELWKHRIAMMVAFSAITAYLLAVKGIEITTLIGLFSGVFLMAGGAGSLNHWQEKNYDALMERTRHRPLPTGIIPSHYALFIAIISIIIGAFILYVSAGIIPALFGLSNVLWYNGIYTPLKRITPFAIIPGSVIGAIPAFIGWSAANVSLLDVRLWILSLFLFFWQIPHFWLLLIKYAEDYEKAGFASIKNAFHINHLRWIIFPWIMITTTISLTFPLFGVVNSIFAAVLIIVSNIMLIFLFIRYLLGKENTESKRLKAAFFGINLYLLLNMLVIVGQRIIAF